MLYDSAFKKYSWQRLGDHISWGLNLSLPCTRQMHYLSGPSFYFYLLIITISAQESLVCAFQGCSKIKLEVLHTEHLLNPLSHLLNPRQEHLVTEPSLMPHISSLWGASGYRELV